MCLSPSEGVGGPGPSFQSFPGSRHTLSGIEFWRLHGRCLPREGGRRRELDLVWFICKFTRLWTYSNVGMYVCIPFPSFYSLPLLCPTIFTLSLFLFHSRYTSLPFVFLSYLSSTSLRPHVGGCTLFYAGTITTSSWCNCETSVFLILYIGLYFLVSLWWKFGRNAFCKLYFFRENKEIWKLNTICNINSQIE